MNVAEFIKNAREKKITDKEILEELKKQAPQKEDSFNRAQSKGMSETDILSEVIKQNENSPTQEEGFIPMKKKEELPQRKNEEAKLWIRIFIALIIVLMVSLSFTLIYRSFFIPQLRAIYPEMVVKEIHSIRPHYPLIDINPKKDNFKRFSFSTEEEYLIQIRNITRQEQDGKIVRIVAEDQRSQDAEIIKFNSFFDIFEIEVPENFFNYIEKDFDLFVYTEERANHLAFMALFDRKDYEDVKWMTMRPWEENIENDFSYFFNYFGENIEESEEELESINYSTRREPVSIRYREGERNMGLYYVVLEDAIIFGTSLRAVQIIIDRYL